MKQQRTSTGTGMGVGGSSILAVFVVLCLTTFATLSLVSAHADLRLSRRAAQSVTAYYAADAQAQRLIDELSAQLIAEGTLPSDRTGVTVSDGATVSLSIPLEGGELTLVARLDFSPVLEGESPVVLEYRVAPPRETASLDEPLQVWDGGGLPGSPMD